MFAAAGLKSKDQDLYVDFTYRLRISKGYKILSRSKFFV